MFEENFGTRPRRASDARRRTLAALCRQVLDVPDGEGRPPRLMAGPEAPARVAVEIFMEQHEIVPVRISRVAAVVAVAGPASAGIRKEDPRQPGAQLLSDFLQVHREAGAGGAL